VVLDGFKIGFVRLLLGGLGVRVSLMLTRNTVAKLVEAIIGLGGRALCAEEHIKLYRDDREEFDEHYHKRSRVKSVYSVLKRVFGNHLSSRRRRSQRNEHYLRTINYNIEIANMTSIKAMVKQLSCHNRKLQQIF